MPLHELLHVLGCVATGGTITRLEISPIYGGDALAKWFPWVTSGGEYAGRLSGFRPAGDWSYLATVLAPLLVLCPLGSALARSAVRRWHAWLFGIGLGAALQPLASLTGDCYEAAAIPLTRLADAAGLNWALSLRGDDVFKIAAQAAALESHLAWMIFAAGCVGSALISALLLYTGGGIAPRSTSAGATSRRVGSARWSRRAVLRTGVGVTLIGAGAWIMKRVFLPRPLDAHEAATLNAFVDTLIPDGEFPGAARTGVFDRLLAEAQAKRQTRRALLIGVQELDREARTHGAADFRSLMPPQREQIVSACADAGEGTRQRTFYRIVRDRAMQLHYAHPLAWKRLPLTHPPQPEGYLDYWQQPDV